MNKKLIWTKSKARLKLFRHNNRNNYHWLFLPGGPGLGSESLCDLVEMLDLPGSMWYVDFPGDGSNIYSQDDESFLNWQVALIEACREFDNVILVAHSSGGMFALATRELEDILKGFILMDSAPHSGWQEIFMKYVKDHPLVETEILQKNYNENPSNALLKNLTIASAPYFSTTKSIKKIINMLASLPYNYRSQRWAEQNFDSSYKATWVPEAIPTLLFAGEQDPITPLKLFTDAKEFNRSNIQIQSIKNASHFPWMDNPEEVKLLFSEYCRWFRLMSSRK